MEARRGGAFTSFQAQTVDVMIFPTIFGNLRYASISEIWEASEKLGKRRRLLFLGEFHREFFALLSRCSSRSRAGRKDFVQVATAVQGTGGAAADGATGRVAQLGLVNQTAVSKNDHFLWAT